MTQERDAEMYRLRLEGKTLREISEDVGISYERVRQVLHRYELHHRLPSAYLLRKEQMRQQKLEAKRAAVDLRSAHKQARSMQSPNYIECIQIDAPLVGAFLAEVEDRVVYIHHDSATIHAKRQRRTYIRRMKTVRAMFRMRNRRTIAVHTWVMRQVDPAFNSKTHCVRHLDGDPLNCQRENFAVLTWSELGLQQAVERGGTPRDLAARTPARQQKPKLAAGYVRAIRYDYADGMTVEELCALYNRGHTTIYNILSGKTYKEQHDDPQT